MKRDSLICKCGHSKYEHNPPSSWEDEDMDDTFCFYESCSCERYDPVLVDVKEATNEQTS